MLLLLTVFFYLFINQSIIFININNFLYQEAHEIDI